MSEYLDFHGLQRYNNKIKEIDTAIINSGAKNMLNWEDWKDVGVAMGTKDIDDINKSITLTATGNDCYTFYSSIFTSKFPQNAYIYVTEGRTYEFTWVYIPHNNQNNDKVAIFGNGVEQDYVFTYGQTQKLSYTVPSGVTFLTFRVGVQTNGNSATYSNLMIRDSVFLDNTYVPYGMTNSQLTEFAQNPITTTQIDDLWS